MLDLGLRAPLTAGDERRESVSSMESPPIKYARVRDDRIAYQVIGDGPINLVYCSGSWSHADMRWQQPLAAALMRRLASFSRVLVFDRRGSGVSDGVEGVETPTWEDGVDDVLAVLDAEGIDRAALYGWADAGPLALLTAATHPERVATLILASTTARFLEAPGYPPGLPPDAAHAIVDMISKLWGTEELVAATVPCLKADRDFVRWNAMYQRASASPRTAARHMRLLLELDLRPVASLVSCPTLVLHHADSPLLGPDHGRWLADNIPDARFLLLKGDPGNLWRETHVTDAVEEFLTGVRMSPVSERVLSTVLFTDVASSTDRATELGDRRWRAVLDRHDEVSRRSVDEFGGQLVKTTGDGVLATFDGPIRAIRCALRLSQSLESIGIDVRSGIHCGEIELRGTDVGGIGVHIASRVLSHASPGEVLVSRTVKDLVMGSEVVFSARGSQTLKGVPGDWELFAVEAG